MDITIWKSTIRAQAQRHRRSRAPDALEDLEQDMYLAILQRQGEVETALQISKDAATKLVLKICREVGQAPSEPVAESINDQAVSKGLTAASLLAGSPDRVQMVSAAVTALPALEQSVIRGIFYNSHTESEMAVELGQSVRQIQKIKASAFVRLTAELTKERHA